jgi:hypothetical protein
MKPRKFSIIIIFLGGFLAFTACIRVGEIKESTASIPLSNAESANIQLRMAAGELNIHGANTDVLLTGSFQYNIKRWEPFIDHHMFGTQTRVTIEQRRSPGITFGRTRNTWDLQLTNRIPLELEMNFGAGRAELDLRNTLLKNINLHMGVGDADIDFSGDRSINLEGSIKGGIGHASIVLPSHIGVRIRLDGGLGSVQAPDFTKDGHIYTNEAYGKTPVSIDLEIKAGIGAIELRLR